MNQEYLFVYAFVWKPPTNLIVDPDLPSVHSVFASYPSSQLHFNREKEPHKGGFCGVSVYFNTIKQPHLLFPGPWEGLNMPILV